MPDAVDARMDEDKMRMALETLLYFYEVMARNTNAVKRVGSPCNSPAKVDTTENGLQDSSSKQ